MGDTAAAHSHNCPAQHLSFRMMNVFLESFIERGGALGWTAVDGAISVNAYGASSFTLLKRGHTQTTDCEYAPSCEAGYSWVSTSWCSWGRRAWMPTAMFSRSESKLAVVQSRATGHQGSLSAR